MKDTLKLQTILELLDEADQRLTELQMSERAAQINDEFNKFLNPLRKIGGFCYHEGQLDRELKNSIPLIDQSEFQRLLIHLVQISHYSKTGNHTPSFRQQIGAVRSIIERALTKPPLRTGKVFYSWQSDSENGANRGFIKDALEIAISQVKASPTLTLDSDTRGETGSPDIINTILRKIEDADIVVADVTLTMHIEDDWRPNPNVLFELGYAMHALGDKRIIMVFNEATCSAKDLPFDLGFKRQMLYRYPDIGRTKGEMVRELASKLLYQLQAIVDAK